MSIRYNIDVYKFLSNKWTWFGIGIVSLLITIIVQSRSSESNIVGDALVFLDIDQTLLIR